MCLAHGPQRSDAGEARTRSPSVSSQALYHLNHITPIAKNKTESIKRINAWIYALLKNNNSILVQNLTLKAPITTAADD